uniref:Reverse transcriptase N-terminal domain-containing protein n=1 Tax=Dasya binghamiae TaxID=1896963 RepID=A0A1C8XS93_9FLOR|nr:hypothetical protein BI108_pgp052 [Dasya binghamiae]AOH77355.1 hypothetical protein [Dasya binghamiae]
MFLKYSLNTYTCWKYLPWKTIYTRIIIIQKKIYKAAKKHNWKYVLKLQKYLINSNEAKITSVQNIIDELYIYNKNKKKIKFNIQDNDKFIIFKSLYNFHKEHYFHIIIEQIKQYLIFLCIKPEWEAKFLFSFYEHKHNNIFNYFYSINKNNLNNNLLKYHINNKNIFISNIIKKIYRLKYINYVIKNLLYYNLSIFSIKNHYNLIEQILNNQFIYLYEFYQFLSKIFFIDINWYNIYLNKINYITYNIKKNQDKLISHYILNVQHYYKFFIDSITLNLFKINIFYKLIKFKYLYKNSLLNSLIFLYYIKLIYPKINKLIYYILKKNNQNILYKYNIMKTDTIYINLFFYNKKVEYMYSNYCK